MTSQNLIVFAVVLACGVYALWTLMPAAARRFLAARLLRLPLGPSWKAVFRRAASAPLGCDCSGCDKVVDLTRQGQGQAQVIRFHTKAGD